MSKYRRVYYPRSSYFFTLVTYNRRPWLASPERIERLRKAIRFVRDRRPFSLDAIVVLPDHLHCIWTMENDADYSTRWQMIKTHFSRFIKLHPDDRGRKRVWQPRFWEHLIRDERDYERHLHYIHFNPVKHGYVTRPADWPYSSFERYVRDGWYSRDWGASQPELIEGMNPE
jgi:putative transposase